MKVYLEQLNLHNYRNFKELELTFNKNIVIILGENGSGKTNILESISLLSPGSGLRYAKHEEISREREGNWSSSIFLQSKMGKANIKYDFLKDKKVRLINYNGSKIKNLELPSLANIIWLTPQMDGIFLGQVIERRKFLDRIVYNFYQEHADNINKYTRLISERLKILNTTDYIQDNNWLDILEQKITSFAIKINKLRLNTTIFLQEAIDFIDTPFPKARLTMSQLFENILEEEKFLELYAINLNKNRRKDSMTKRTNFSMNKSELVVEHNTKNQLAKFCSTGEQKALLISILLGQIEATKTVAKTYPILLLDEIFVHLDDKRKDFLAEVIINSKLQTFITATDISGLEKIAKNAQIIEI